MIILSGYPQDVVIPRVSRPAVVMGSAETVVRARELDSILPIKIAVGDLPWRAPELGPFDFWMCANSEWPLPWRKKDQKIIASTNVGVVLVSIVSVANLRSEQVSGCIESIRARSESQRPQLRFIDTAHASGHTCEPHCSICVARQAMGLEFSIQECLKMSANLDTLPFGGGDTVALHGFALAILMGANPIYLSGIEIPMRAGDYTYIHGRHQPLRNIDTIYGQIRDIIRPRDPNTTSVLGETIDCILADFGALTSIANELGIRVVLLSETSRLRGIKGIEFGDFGPDCPSVY